MIRLTLIGGEGKAAVLASAPYFRINGGAVWIGPGASDQHPLIRYVNGRWISNGIAWYGMRFEGKSRLIFGLPRDPSGVSDELESLSIQGATLSANGIPFAEYDASRDMWRGAAATNWWHAFRVEMSGYRAPAPRSGENDAVASSTPDSSDDRRENSQRLN